MSRYCRWCGRVIEKRYHDVYCSAQCEHKREEERAFFAEPTASWPSDAEVELFQGDLSETFIAELTPSEARQCMREWRSSIEHPTNELNPWAEQPSVGEIAYWTEQEARDTQGVLAL